MKHELGEVCKFSQRDGWYIWLECGKYLSNSGKPFDFNGSDENHEEKIKQIIFPTQELAEQTLNKYNNMETKRDYSALKQEGLKFAPDGFIYIGRGDPKNKLDKDWQSADIHMLCKDEIPDRKLDIVGDNIGDDWTGNSTNAHYFVREEIWNKKFPNEKKPITLDEIKSRLAEAKKLIGKKIKRLSSYNAGIIHNVDKVNLHLENPPVGPNHNDFFAKNGYVISLHESGSSKSREANTVFQDGGFKVVEDVKVVLNSSYTAIISHDSIKVGCQTFSLDIIDKLVEARKQLA